MKRRVQDNSQVPHYLPFDDQNRAAKAKSVPPALSSSTNFQFHYSALSASSLASKTSREFETLRLSRHDNPILKQIFSSRDNVDETINESENVYLIDNEKINVDTDPFSLQQLHQYMIRSPPPTAWPSCDDLSDPRLLDGTKPVNCIVTDELNSATTYLHHPDTFYDPNDDIVNLIQTK